MTAKQFDKVSALKAFEVFLEAPLSLFGGKSPALYVIENTNSCVRDEVATDAVSLCLDTFVKQLRVSRVFRNTESLLLALSITHVATIIHKDLAERLVQLVALAGFHGRFPDLPLRLLGRPMNASEVTALITAYVSNSASRCESDEEKFKQWAALYIPRSDADVQIERIEAFVREWNTHVD